MDYKAENKRRYAQRIESILKSDSDVHKLLEADCAFDKHKEFTERVQTHKIDVRANNDYYLIEAADSGSDKVVKAIIILGNYTAEEVRAIAENEICLNNYIYGFCQNIPLGMWFIDALRITADDVEHSDCAIGKFHAVDESHNRNNSEYARWILDHFNLHEKYHMYKIEESKRN